jgi:hypothetical protein
LTDTTVTYQQTKEVFEMAASLVIEEESGSTTGWIHPHNGYYAGDFSATWNDAGTYADAGRQPTDRDGQGARRSL